MGSDPPMYSGFRGSPRAFFTLTYRMPPCSRQCWCVPRLQMPDCEEDLDEMSAAIQRAGHLRCV